MSRSRNRRLPAGLWAAALCGALLWGAPAAAAEGGGWELLTRNRVEEALAAFQAATAGGDASAADLEGLYQIYRLKCHARGCVETSLRLLRQARATPLGAVFIDRISAARRLFAAAPLVRPVLTQIIAEPDTHPLTRRAAANLLAALMREADEAPAAAKLVAEYTPFWKHWNLAIGPFLNDGDPWLERELPPEADLGRSEYTWLDRTARPGGVSFRIDLLAETIDFGAERKNDEVVFLVSAFTCPAAREVILGIHPNTGTKVWLNGYPVFQPFEAVHDEESTAYRRCTFGAGVNLLVVKTDAAAFGLHVYRPDFSAFREFTPLDPAPPDRLREGVLPVRGFRFARVEPDPVRDCFTGELWSRCQRIEHAAAAGRIEEMRRLVLEELDLDARCGLRQVLEADYFRRAIDAGHDDGARLKDASQKAVAGALAGLGEQPLPLLWDGAFKIDNKSYDEGYKSIARALELTGRDTEPLAMQVRYFRKRGWDEEVEKALVEMTARTPYALVDLHDDLRRTRQFPRALEVLRASFRAGGLTRSAYFKKLLDYDAGDEVFACADRLIACDPHAAGDILSDAGDYALRRGDRTRAWAYFARALEQDGRDVWSMRRLAQLDWEDGAAAAAVALWQRMAGIGADAPRIQARIRAALGQSFPLADRDLDLAAVFTPRDRDHRNYPDSEFVNLLDLTLIEVQPDGSYEALTHNAFLAVNKKGVEKLGEVTLPENDDDVGFIRAVTAEGQVHLPVAIQKNGSARYASMPNVVAGTVIEYAFIQFGAVLDDFRDFQIGYNFGNSTEPTVRARMVVRVPKDRPLHWRDNRGMGPEVETTPTHIIYTWDRRDLPALKEELAMPSAEELAEAGRIGGDRRDFGLAGGYFMDVEHDFSCAAADAQGAVLTGGGKDQAAAISAVLAWVRSGVMDGDDARSIRDCFLTRRGNAYNRGALVRYWLQRAGIPCTPVFINSQFFMREDRETGAAGLTDFSRRLLVVPGRGGESDTWIDIDDNFHYGITGMLDGNTVSQAALFRKDGCLVLGRVREKENDLRNTDYRLTCRVEETGDCAVTAEGALYGTLAGKVRRLFENPQTEKRVLENLAGELVPRLQVTANSFTGRDDLDRPIGHALSGRILGFALREGRDLVFKPFLDVPDVTRMIGKEARIYDYVLNAPILERSQVNYELPPGFFVVRVPERCVITSPYGVFIADFRLEGTSLKAAVSLGIPGMRVPATSYPRFMAFLEEVKRYLAERTVAIRKLDDPPPSEPIEAFLPVWAD
ncbi:MAG: DUF3857 domain-containing protein [Planctomycetota bacterium]